MYDKHVIVTHALFFFCSGGVYVVVVGVGAYPVSILSHIAFRSSAYSPEILHILYNTFRLLSVLIMFHGILAFIITSSWSIMLPQKKGLKISIPFIRLLFGQSLIDKPAIIYAIGRNLASYLRHTSRKRMSQSQYQVAWEMRSLADNVNL